MCDEATGLVVFCEHPDQVRNVLGRAQGCRLVICLAATPHSVDVGGLEIGMVIREHGRHLLDETTTTNAGLAMQEELRDTGRVHGDAAGLPRRDRRDHPVCIELFELLVTDERRCRLQVGDTDDGENLESLLQLR